MKYSIIKLISLIALVITSIAVSAQFKTSKEFGALMNEVQVGISIFDQKFLNENFSTTIENPASRSDISYTYQLSAQHNSLPIHFTLGLYHNKTVNVDNRVRETSIAVGVKSGLDVKHSEEERLNYLGAKQIGYIHASLTFDALEGDYFNTSSNADKGKYFKYDKAFVYGMNSENGYVEIVCYYNKEADSEKEVEEDLNKIITSFRFKEPGAENKNFAGVGITIGQNSKYYQYQIMGVVKGGVSDKAGVLPGDFIIQVDGKFVADLDMSRLVNLIRGEVNSNVEILVKRGTMLFSYNLTRVPIDLTSQIEMIKPKSIDLSRIYFNNTTAYILGNDLTANNYKNFIENVDDGKKYKYFLDFPMSTPGTITKTAKNSRIEYVLYSTKQEEKVKAFYDRLKGYLLDEYPTGYFFIEDKGNTVLIEDIMEEVLAELSFTSTATGFYTVKYVFYKFSNSSEIVAQESAYIYSSDEAKCKVEFPSEFTKSTTSDDISKTLKVDAKSEGMMFLLESILYDMDEETIKRVEQDADYLLQTTMEMFVAKINAEIVNSVEDHNGNVKGKIATITSGENKIFYSVYIKGNIIYQLVALELEVGKLNDKLVKNFKNSFEIF